MSEQCQRVDDFCMTIQAPCKALGLIHEQIIVLDDDSSFSRQDVESLQELADRKLVERVKESQRYCTEAMCGIAAVGAVVAIRNDVIQKVDQAKDSL